MVHVQTPSGKSLWTIIETKLHAPGDTSQLARIFHKKAQTSCKSLIE
jgi:hypothetical protein